MTLQQAIIDLADNGLGNLRREEPLEPAHPLQFVQLFGHASFQGLVPLGELLRLLLDLIMQGLDAQDRFHAGDQSSVIDGFGKVLIAAAFKAGDNVARVRFRRDQNDRHERQGRIGFQQATHFQAVSFWHHDVK
jgi:hypothetical protein